MNPAGGRESIWSRGALGAGRELFFLAPYRRIIVADYTAKALPSPVWEKLMLGLSTRKYGDAVRECTEAYGLEKSAVRAHFIECEPDEIEGSDGAPIGQSTPVCVDDRRDAVSGAFGKERQRTRSLVDELLADLLERGLEFTEPRLYVLDGGKALSAAVKKYAGELEETLTVHRLYLPMQLRRTRASTNVIESAFSIVEHVCKNVKRWHGADQRERWVGSGLLVAENTSAGFKDTSRFQGSSKSWKL